MSEQIVKFAKRRDVQQAAVIGLGGAGAIGSIVSGIQQREAQREAASEAEQLGEQAATERRRAGARLRARQRVAFARGGVEVTSPTALDVRAQAARDAELDALRRQFQFQREADRLRAQGTAALTQGLLGGTGTILSTIGILRKI